MIVFAPLVPSTMSELNDANFVILVWCQREPTKSAVSVPLALSRVWTKAFVSHARLEPKLQLRSILCTVDVILVNADSSKMRQARHRANPAQLGNTKIFPGAQDARNVYQEHSRLPREMSNVHLQR